MNTTMGWSLGICCGLPLVGALAFGGVAASSSDPATIACLAVIALALGFVAFRFFAHEQEDEWEPRELIHTRDRQDGS